MGLKNLPRQIAGFPEFRRAMLRSLPTYPSLSGWRARDKEDLGIMLLEMWAYICDSLSFYDKVIAQEAYIYTATQRPSIRKLVGLLGYLPAPATASEVKIAALGLGYSPIIVLKGTAFQSSGFSGNPPQVFELNNETVIHPLTNKWKIAAVQSKTITKENPTWFLIEPKAEIKPYTKLLLFNYHDTFQEQILTIKSVSPYIGADGKRYTKLELQSFARLRIGTPLSDLWLVLEDPNSMLRRMAKVMELIEGGNEELVINHMRNLNFSSEDDFRSGAPVETALESPRTDRIKLAMQYNLPTAGIIVNESKTTLSFSDPILFSTQVEEPLDYPEVKEFAITDKTGRSILIKGEIDYEQSKLNLGMNVAWTPELAAPVELFGNLLEASRGETIRNEILGSGNLMIANQQFILAKKPLTYLLTPTAENDRGVSSTLRVYVNGVKWKEVPGFYGRHPEDEIYTIRQDDAGESYIKFGDGNRGKRIPSGSNNVVAYYRYGAGKAHPPANSITQIKTSVPGLDAIHNPFSAAGGADAESKENIQKNAPKSALLLGRAVSILDMETAAFAFPGVLGVQAAWHWHATKQTAVVCIWYIGEPPIKKFLLKRLHLLTDPSTPIAVEQAISEPVHLNIEIEIDPRYIAENVTTAVRLALTDSVNGLLSIRNSGIGKPMFRSRIFERVISVAGVVSVKNILWNNTVFSEYAKKPSTGHYFDFEKGGITINGA